MYETYGWRCYYGMGLPTQDCPQSTRSLDCDGIVEEEHVDPPFVRKESGIFMKKTGLLKQFQGSALAEL